MLCHTVWFIDISFNAVTHRVVYCRFVFIMGTSIAISFDAARRRGVSKSRLLLRILRRTAILFILGLALSNHGTSLVYLLL